MDKTLEWKREEISDSIYRPSCSSSSGKFSFRISFVCEFISAYRSHSNKLLNENKKGWNLKSSSTFGGCCWYNQVCTFECFRAYGNFVYSVSVISILKRVMIVNMLNRHPMVFFYLRNTSLFQIWRSIWAENMQIRCWRLFRGSQRGNPNQHFHRTRLLCSRHNF